MEEFLTGTSEEINMRKYANRLYYAGLGVVVFALWDYIREIMSYRLDKKYAQMLADLIEKEFSDIPDIDIGQVPLGVVVFFIYLLIAFLSLFIVLIGLCGVRDARQYRKQAAVIKKRGLYLLFGLVLAIFTFLGLDTIRDGLYSSDGNRIAEYITEITSLFIQFDMVYSGVRLKITAVQARRKASLKKEAENAG